MQQLDLTLPTPAENLALEEALLEAVEARQLEAALRFWVPTGVFVVVGYANQVAREVDLTACARLGIPVLRRTSGGGAVVQMPGCLNYALVLPTDGSYPVDTIPATNAWVLARQAKVLAEVLGEPVERCGDTDLAVGGVKVAGNAQRRTRRAVLFHGSVLVSAELSWMERLLPSPSRMPAYRAGRPHRAFVRNLGVSLEVVRRGIAAHWDAWKRLEYGSVLEGRVAELVTTKYGTLDWNRRF